MEHTTQIGRIGDSQRYWVLNHLSSQCFRGELGVICIDERLCDNEGDLRLGQIRGVGRGVLRYTIVTRQEENKGNEERMNVSQ